MSRSVLKTAIFVDDAACRRALESTSAIWSVFVYPDGYGKLMLNRQSVGGRTALYRVNVKPRAHFSRNDRLRPSSFFQELPTSDVSESGPSVSQEKPTSPAARGGRLHR